MNMASSSLSPQFRLTLSRIARLLTKDSVQQLAFLCQHIAPSRRQELNCAMDLFDQLQEHGVIHEKEVDTLICWLNELQLEEPSRQLKEYKKTHLEKKFETNDTCNEQGCVTNNGKFCARYFDYSHRHPCEGVELNQEDRMVDIRQVIPQRPLDSIQKVTTEVDNPPQINFNQYKQDRGEPTGRLGFATPNETVDFQDMTEKGLSQLDGTGEPTLSVELNQSASLEGANYEWYAELSREATKDADTEESYQGLVRKHTVGLPSSRGLIGGVMIRESQLIHVFDERQRRGAVLLVCIDPSDSRIEYFKHLVTVKNNKSPVVMSYKEMKYGGINHMLFAVGNMVFIVHPQKTGCVYDSVQSVASLRIDHISEGSWITSIAAHRLQSECDEFLISTRGSNELREYQISGRALRTIHTMGCVPSITCISYVENLFALCGSRNDVYLIQFDGRKKQEGHLRAFSDTNRMLPVCVIWTGGAGWIALFVSNFREDSESCWRVSCYGETGELIKICIEGTSTRYRGIPVGIARWGNTGFISFSDCSVKSFQY